MRRDNIGVSVHRLKILPEYFQGVLEKKKTFEIRKNDRDFKEGDIVELCEFDGKKYTGNVIEATIDYLTDYEQKEGFVVFSIGVYEVKMAHRCLSKWLFR